MVLGKDLFPSSFRTVDIIQFLKIGGTQVPISCWLLTGAAHGSSRSPTTPCHVAPSIFTASNGDTSSCPIAFIPQSLSLVFFQELAWLGQTHPGQSPHLKVNWLCIFIYIGRILFFHRRDISPHSQVPPTLKGKGLPRARITESHIRILPKIPGINVRWSQS